MDNYFITGISTEVGKTVVSAIVAQALGADYWKPVQAGSLDYTDTHRVRDLVTNPACEFHDEAYRLTTPMSPHAAAAIEDLKLDINGIVRPELEKDLVIEGAGGLLVPLNNKHTIADLIDPEDKVIVVSSGYLGSINHTLLTLQYLEDKGLNCVGVVYNQVKLAGTIEIITEIADVPVIGIMEEEREITKETVARYAELWQDQISKL